jgi:hypothetical protein
MTWGGFVLAFVLGWLACWYLSSFLVKRVLRKGDAMMTDALKGLPQTSLVRIYKAAGAEIEHRKAEID